eukprot:4330217-Amphidinium_carterae.1
MQVEQSLQKEELDVDVMQQLAVSLCAWLRGDKNHETRLPRDTHIRHPQSDGLLWVPPKFE